MPLAAGLKSSGRMRVRAPRATSVRGCHALDAASAAVGGLGDAQERRVVAATPEGADGPPGDARRIGAPRRAEASPGEGTAQCRPSGPPMLRWQWFPSRVSTGMPTMSTTAGPPDVRCRGGGVPREAPGRRSRHCGPPTSPRRAPAGSCAPPAPSSRPVWSGFPVQRRRLSGNRRPKSGDERPCIAGSAGACGTRQRSTDWPIVPEVPPRRSRPRTGRQCSRCGSPLALRRCGGQGTLPTWRSGQKRPATPDHARNSNDNAVRSAPPGADTAGVSPWTCPISSLRPLPGPPLRDWNRPAACPQGPLASGLRLAGP